MVSEQPAASLTLRQFYNGFYHKTDLAKSSSKRIHCELLRFERLTSNPPIGGITNEVAAEFRQRAIEAGLASRTINTNWVTIRGILRIASPEGPGNPWGLGVIPKCPAMRPVKEIRSRPRRLDLADIGAVYMACEHASYPKKCGLARDWWRALVVATYFIGLRKGDLLSLRHDQFDLRAGTLRFTASKTSKEDDFPLHPLVIEHLKPIWHPERTRVFDGIQSQGGRLYALWGELLVKAGVSDRWAFHDLRRTAASEIDRVERGLAAIFLQHAPEDVTSRFYTNAVEELGEAIGKMRYPAEFAGGVSAPVIDAEGAKRREMPPAVDQSEWSFRPGSFSFRGRWYALPGTFPKLLELLVRADGPLTWEQVHAANLGRKLSVPKTPAPAKIRQQVHTLRGYLRERLGLPEAFDPCPCVSRGDGGAWMIRVPPMSAEAGGLASEEGADDAA